MSEPPIFYLELNICVFMYMHFPPATALLLNPLIYDSLIMALFSLHKTENAVYFHP